MTPDDKILISFLEEKAEQSLANDMITCSKFLDMHQRSVASGMRLPFGVRRMFYGGFDDAERTVALWLPEYVQAENESELNEFFRLSPDDCPVSILGIKKDKFSKQLTHRDYLGALMGLGISRDMTGDITVGGEGCHIAVIKSMAEYIAENLTSAGRGTLSIKILAPFEAADIKKNEGIPDSFTVSSPRLDSVVKNAFGISRDAACAAIKGGLVFLNDIECGKPDKKIAEGDKITLRHRGRIIISALPGKSKKGRDIVNIIRFTVK